MRRLLFALPLIVGLLAPATGRTETLKTAIGSLELPDGLKELDRSEAAAADTGAAEGMFVFTKAGDLPRAIFIVTYVRVNEAASPAPFNALETAAKMGNPFDPSLGAKDAKAVSVGGAPGGKYDGKLPNGLRAVSYAVEKDGYRVIALLKAPPSGEYRKLLESFAQALEGFAWAIPATSPAPVASPAAAAPATVGKGK